MGTCHLCMGTNFRPFDYFCSDCAEGRVLLGKKKSAHSQPEVGETLRLMGLSSAVMVRYHLVRTCTNIVEKCYFAYFSNSSHATFYVPWSGSSEGRWMMISFIKLLPFLGPHPRKVLVWLLSRRLHGHESTEEYKSYLSLGCFGN